MDPLTFISRIVDSLAWPITLLVALYLLRGPVSQLIPSTQRVKFRDLEIEFDHGVRELQRRAVEDLPSGIDETRNIDVDRKMAELTRTSPTRAVLESWKVVNRAGQKLLASRNLEVPGDGPRRFKELEEALEASGLVGESTLDLFASLRLLRNKVAHAPGFEVDRERASDYVDVALKLTA
ncbi:MAG: hypothetical protein MI919_41270, partial [Holophagales bacterium]|nr:hypothetical protein [Holophagales bacterium]